MSPSPAPATSTVHEFYGLQDARTGELVRLDCDDYPMFTADPGYPVYEREDPESLALALLKNTPSYNALDETPNWGAFSRDRLVPVKVRTVLEVEAFELKEPLSVKTVDLRDIPYVVGRNYAGQELDPGAKEGLVFWLVQLPADVSLDDARALEGQVVYAGDRWTRRKLFKVLPVPADYVSLERDGKAADALFLASLCGG